MTKKYALTAAQNMHYRWIKSYGTQQVSGLSIVAAFQADMDIGLLKKSINEEIKSYSCLRLQFTPPDSKERVKQYIADFEAQDFDEKDLTSLSFAQADETMQKWAYRTFDGDDIPMCEFFIVHLPEGYHGFFVHMDHRLCDSVGIAIMVNGIMSYYGHYKYGMPLPEDQVDFEKVLEADLEKEASPKRLARAKKFWDSQLDLYGEPLYSDIQGVSVLEQSRKKHKNPALRAADIEKKQLQVLVADYVLEADSTARMIDFCREYVISPTNLLLLVIRTYLSKVCGGQEDITVENFISRRATRDEIFSGGSRTMCYPCRTVIPADTTFLEAAQRIQDFQNRVYMYGNYDPELIRDEMKKRYKTPKDTSYVSCYLTYQPPLSTSNESFKLPSHIKWFANGAATKKMYLTVSHLTGGGLNFSYHYQNAQLTEKNMELLYYYMMRIMFRGIEDPRRTVGEIIDMV
ncbi:MAG: chromosome condensation protein [Lachnospiraceae bacterium]|nr:chromosome condensation protein [Lachnospiraceae bacterium]